MSSSGLDFLISESDQKNYGFILKFQPKRGKNDFIEQVEKGANEGQWHCSLLAPCSTAHSVRQCYLASLWSFIWEVYHVFFIGQSSWWMYEALLISKLSALHTHVYMHMHIYAMSTIQNQKTFHHWIYIEHPKAIHTKMCFSYNLIFLEMASAIGVCVLYLAGI